MSRIGKSQLRFEDDRLLRGHGCFTADQINEEDVVLVFLRSPVAAATVKKIDIQKARAVPGFIDIFNCSDMEANGTGSFAPRGSFPGPDGGAMRTPPFSPLANGVVHYCGQPILGVLAEDRASAETICEHIEVTFEGRTAVSTVDKALSSGAPIVWDMFPDNQCFQVEKGDADKVLQQMAQATHIIEHRLVISRVTAAAIEPRAMRAWFDEDTNKYRLAIGTQTPNRIRPDLAIALGVTADEIDVVASDCGGSFGMKNTAFPEYAAGLWAARKYRRKISWCASRLESFLADSHAREQTVDVKLALNENGHFLALDVEINANLGAFLGPSTIHPIVGNIGGVTGVYAIPASHVCVKGIFSNTQSMSPYRGAGRPEATYIIERIIDIAASQLGYDKVALRRANMIKPTEMPFQTGLVFTYDSGNFPKLLDTAIREAGYSDFAKRRDASMANGFLRGLGIANPIEIAGGPAKTPHPEYVKVTVFPTGSATLVSGSSDSGQGHLTTLRQILHTQLGTPLEEIELLDGDSRAAPSGTGTFGSRTVTAAGTSIVKCSQTLIDKMHAAAANLLDADVDQVFFDEGYYIVYGTNRSVSFMEAVKLNGVPVSAEFNGSADNATFPNGCHICEVQIDQATGAVEICSYIVVDDVGQVINPLLLEGQIAGGLAQGIGQALMENVVYDKSSGQLVSGSFMDYALPRAADLPAFSVISQPTPTASNPLGAKGAGEAGTVGALAAVMNAVCDALSSVGAGPIDMPATSCNVWSALNKSI